MQLNKKIKVLYITGEFENNISGGIGRVVNGIFNNMKNKQNIKIGILLFKKFYIDNIDNIKKRFFLKKFKNILKELLNNDQYNIVHFTHNCSGTEYAIKLIRVFFPRIKIIYSCHSISKYENNIRLPDNNLINSEEYIINNIDYIHVLNKASLSFLKQAYGKIINSKSVIIIPNGIEENQKKIDIKWGKKLIKKCDKKIKILCLSRWSNGKGLEVLLDSIPYVIKQYNEVKFIIAGRKKFNWDYNGKEYIKVIDKKINKFKDHIIKLGWLNDIQVNTIFTLGDLWIMPSFLEYFPYSILEPMLNRIPIISSRIECVIELLEENKECLCYAPQDPIELGNKILKLIQDINLRNKLVANAYLKVKKELNWEKISQMYIDMYNKI